MQAVLMHYMNENKLNPSSYAKELPFLSVDESFDLKRNGKLARSTVAYSLLKRIRKTCKQALLMVLIMLHDKPEVEEHLTLARYICMEGFVELPRIPNPQKMISKFSVVVRSRFTFWVQQKLFKFIESILSGSRYNMTTISITGSKRKKLIRENMYNHYIDEEVDSEGELINMFYIGYAVNKNQTPNTNVIGKLYSKILGWEMNFTPDMIGEIGIKEFENAKDYKDHEYSCNWVKMITDYAKSTIRKVYGKDPEDHIEKCFLRQYAGQTIIKTLGTMKASTTFNGMNCEQGSGPIRRLKVMEAAKDFIVSDKVYMFEIVQECLSKLREDGGLFIDLFKKSQHGGLREIYILNIQSRVVQHCDK